MARRFSATAQRRHHKTKNRQKHVMQRRRKQFAQMNMDETLQAQLVTAEAEAVTAAANA
ncbi:MAG: hypothetical protein II007_04150 [Gammaproteobacteria bacterium]|nr:hypothetical protein [Gammaproteobacteria bacterium]